MIPVCLLSCDRYDYTMQTARSFLAHNPGGFELWHSDDASTDGRLRKDVMALGFKPLEYTGTRVGVTEMVRRSASAIQSEWMLLLENDWETVAPFPWKAFHSAQNDGVWSFRLYGRHKEREGRSVSTVHLGKSNTPVKWRCRTGYEVGDIHWGNPPAVSRVKTVELIHDGAKSEQDAIQRSGLLTECVARVLENVVYHIGEQRTPHFRC